MKILIIEHTKKYIYLKSVSKNKMGGFLRPRLVCYSSRVFKYFYKTRSCCLKIFHLKGPQTGWPTALSPKEIYDQSVAFYHINLYKQVLLDITKLHIKKSSL